MTNGPQKLLLAPHNDDEALFASFICLREKPTIVIITDSYKQFNRGETGITAEIRKTESNSAATILGCPIKFLGIPDTNLEWSRLCALLQEYPKDTIVYAPAIQGGNRQHDLVGYAALKCFKTVYQYTTYTKSSLYTTGEIEIVPTKEELRVKEEALLSFKSQIAYTSTQSHFDAVRGKSEWLIKTIPWRRVRVTFFELKMVIRSIKRYIKK